MEIVPWCHSLRKTRRSPSFPFRNSSHTGFHSHCHLCKELGEHWFSLKGSAICGQVKEIRLRCRSSSAAALHFHTSIIGPIPFLLRTEMFRNSLFSTLKCLQACNSHILNHIINASIYMQVNNNTCAQRKE